MRFSVLLTMVLLPVCGGCQQGPFGSSAAPPASSNTVPVGNLDARVQNLDQKASKSSMNLPSIKPIRASSGVFDALIRLITLSI